MIMQFDEFLSSYFCASIQQAIQVDDASSSVKMRAFLVPTQNCL